MPPINPIAEATSDELSLASPESVIFNVRTSTGVVWPIIVLPNRGLVIRR